MRNVAGGGSTSQPLRQSRTQGGSRRSHSSEPYLPRPYRSGELLTINDRYLIM